MKLDAGDQESFSAINRPVGGLKIEDIVNGLQRLPILIVQSVLVNGEITNIHGETFERWAERLATLHPRIVQIYSTERPTAKNEVVCVSPEKLQQIATELNERHGLNVHAYWQN